MPTPRHASLAAIDPVETVTPPATPTIRSIVGDPGTIPEAVLAIPLDESEIAPDASRAGWLVLLIYCKPDAGCRQLPSLWPLAKPGAGRAFRGGGVPRGVPGVSPGVSPRTLKINTLNSLVYKH